MKFKVFDAHSDILYDVYQSSLKGDFKRFDEYHLKQLENKINGGIWTLYSPNEFDLLEAIRVSKSLIDLNKFEVVLGLEGLRNLKQVSDLKELYSLGFRHVMLTWNEANDYATGIKGPKDRGVTLLGYKVLDFLVEHDMIIDLSHLNEQSFYDVLNYTNKNIIVSHSNIYELHEHPRNLKLEQLKKLKEANGMLGLTLVGSFLSDNFEERTLDEFVKHLKYAIDIMGIDNVCFGFDFMDYFNSPQTSNLEELKSANEINNLFRILIKHGFENSEIEKLTYYNIYNKFKKNIIKK